MSFSCKEEQSKFVEPQKTKIQQASIFRLQHIGNDLENLMSFPVWFETSLIKKNKIKVFTKEIYHVSVNTADEFKENELELREKRVYHFDENGLVYQVDGIFYFDDQKLCSTTFTYKGKPDQNGYVEEIEQSFVLPENLVMEETELPFHLVKKTRSGSKFASYIDIRTAQKIHFMLAKKFFGPLSVDSIIHPGEKDMVILGKAAFPQKMYSVKNKVHETKVNKFVYNGNSLILNEKDDFPFVSKRNIVYDKNGYCNQMIDSLFSENKFINKTLIHFDLNVKHLPILMKKLKINAENNSNLIAIEKYKYEFYE